MSERSVNRIELLGRVAGVPYIPDSMPKVARFTIVTHRYLSDGRERSDFHRCVAFNKNAEVMESRKVSKGDRIYVTGPIEYTEVERDGLTLVESSIVVRELVLLGKEEERAH